MYAASSHNPKYVQEQTCNTRTQRVVVTAAEKALLAPHSQPRQQQRQLSYDNGESANSNVDSNNNNGHVDQELSR